MLPYINEIIKDIPKIKSKENIITFATLLVISMNFINIKSKIKIIAKSNILDCVAVRLTPFSDKNTITF
jgi:hypothetical protein